MPYFLESTASYLIDRFAGNTGSVCVVLPNRRSGLFLKKYMAQRLSGPILAPAIYSIEDFVFHLSGLQKVEPAYLLFELYEVYVQVEEKKAAPFSEFLKWGEVVIHDFNDVDLSLADPNELFGFLSESKAISLWNLDDKPLTEFELKYLRFFSSLKDYYQLLKEKLMDRGLAYQGMAYRHVSGQLADESFHPGWKTIVFAGFNALSAAEMSIIKQLRARGMADLLWDADTYYMDDPRQEAGLFLNQNKRALGLKEMQWVGDHFTTDRKKIHFIGVPRIVGQAKVAGSLLEKLGAENAPLDRTSVVLNDETLLSPLLNSLPESVKAFNLTMGLPLKNTVLHGLVTGFLTLNENALRFPRGEDGDVRFYYKDVLRLLEHPSLSGFINQESADGLTPAQKIVSGNQVFYTSDALNAIFAAVDKNWQEDLAIIFTPWGNHAINAIDAMLFVLKKLKLAFSANASGAHEIDLEYIYHFSKLFNKLKVYFTRYPFLQGLDALSHVLKQLLRSISIPFYGEPLMGVQIMGMLETRTLDFDQVIMLSVNEDFLPGGSQSSSFIPYDIRRKFRLSTHQERNAVSAYHFYRLLQRAQNVYLLYNTEAGDLGGGDRSRFMAQIEHELVRYGKNIEIHSELLAVAPDYQNTEEEIEVEKTPDILEKINLQAKTGFSASALNSFRNCTLQYYFRYIAGIKESEEVEETIEANTLGTVVHEALQLLYTPEAGKVLVPEVFSRMKPMVAETVAAAFRKYYGTGDIRFGKNLLIAKVAEAFVARFLDAEKKWVKTNQKINKDLIIKGLELILEEDYSSEALPRTIRLKGTIDRIDEEQDIVRIIDYKTGRVENRDLLLKEWETLLIPGRNDKIFQLLFYSLLFSQQGFSSSKQLEAGIYSFRNLSPGLLKLQLPDVDSLMDALPLFSEILDRVFQDLFDRSQTFRQTTAPKVCEYCSFKGVCNR